MMSEYKSAWVSEYVGHQIQKGDSIISFNSSIRLLNSQDAAIKSLQQQLEQANARNAELNPGIVTSCKTCSGHGMIGGMTQEGGEGWSCDDCDGTGVFINPQYKAEIEANAIIKAIENLCDVGFVNGASTRLILTDGLERYASNLRSEGGE